MPVFTFTNVRGVDSNSSPYLGIAAFFVLTEMSDAPTVNCSPVANRVWITDWLSGVAPGSIAFA